MMKIEYACSGAACENCALLYLRHRQRDLGRGKIVLP
jgi:hypothetical protein